MRSRSNTDFISIRNGISSQLALRPRPVLLCACTPVATQVNAMWLRCPRTGAMPVGSTTMMPCGFTRRTSSDVCAISRAPCLVVSSSVVISSVIGTRLGQRARRDDGRRHRPLHVGAAEAVQDAIGVEPRRPRVLLPAGVGHRVHMAGQRDAADRAAMRHQRALRHAGIVGVVEALDVEAGQCRFHPLGHRQVGDEAAAVERHQLARQGDDSILKSVIAVAILDCQPTRS